MKKQTTLPVEGKAIRFAPSRNQQPSASVWKVWAEGSEVYALSRTHLGMSKISVHASGQVHCRMEEKMKHDLAPLMQIGCGPWFHAFELRFLLSDGALSPFKLVKSLEKKNKPECLIEAPEGFVLHANLILGSTGTPHDCPPPVGLTGQPLWRTRLRDGRLAVLVGRLLELDDQNREHIRYMREEITVTYSTLPTSSYVEVWRLHSSSEGGNVVLIVPMGAEALRSEGDGLPKVGKPPPAPRLFRYRSPPSTVELTAPNELGVAVIQLAAVDTEIRLERGVPNLVALGLVSMRIEPRNLIRGSKFIAPPRRVVCCPNLAGASPRQWEYTIPARFDGFRLTAELRMMSTGLDNKNLAAPIPGLDANEEIVMTIPAESLILASTLDVPSTSVDLVGRFILRDRHRV